MGHTIGGVILVGSMAATLGVTAIVAGPRLVRGSEGEAAVTAPAAPAHHGTLESIAELIGRSHEVLAVHPPGATPHTQVVLWLDDREHRGVIDPEEVGVLSHSPVLQTVTFASYEPPPPSDDPLLALRPAPPVPEITRVTVQEARFARRWRACEGVRSRLVARGISELRVTPAPHARASSHRLRISLTWAAETPDGPDKASIVVDARGPAAAGRSER